MCSSSRSRLRLPALALAAALALVAALRGTPAEAANAPAFEPIAAASPAPLSDRSVEPGDVECFFDGLLAGQFAAHKLAGAAVVVVKDGEVVFAKGYGQADIARAIPVDPQRTRFPVGSISKLFVWTAVMQLAEQGKLDLDADVNRYLTQFQIHDAYRTPVTLRALLTHSGGFEDKGAPFAPDVAGRYATLGAFLAAHFPQRVMPPVTDYAHASRPYSNWGPLLAALIVENVSGERFDRYAEHHILQPLGMASSRFQTAADAGGPNRALGYRFSRGTMAGTLEDMTSSGPAGALIATPQDIARFMIAHLQDGALDGGRILSPETAERMHARSAASNPHLNGMSLGFIEAHMNGRRALRHDGSTQFNHSELDLFPDQHLGVFVTYNSYDGGYARAEAIKAFVDHYFPATLPRIRPPADFPQRAAQYAGSYRSLRRSFTTFEKILGSPSIGVSVLPNGRLLAAGSQWTEVAPDTFRNNAGDMLGFNRDAAGKVASLNLGYSIVPAEKIAWYEDLPFHALITVVCLVCAVAGVAWGVRWRRWRAQPGRFLRFAGWSLAAMGLANLLSFGLIALVLTQGIWAIMTHGVPSALLVGLWIAIASVPLTAAALAMTATAFRAAAWSRRARFAYAGLTVASAVYLAVLAYWNLLGIHLG